MVVFITVMVFVLGGWVIVAEFWRMGQVGREGIEDGGQIERESIRHHLGKQRMQFEIGMARFRGIRYFVGRSR